MFQKVSIRPFSYYRSQTSRLCGVVLLSSALLLSACDTQGIEWPDIPGLPDFNARAAERRAAEKEAAMAAENMADSTSHMAAPAPSAAPIPLAAPSGPSVSISSQQTEKELGYNPKNIFGKSLRSDSERLDRLERAVQDMRNDFDLVRPSIKRLLAVESDIQNLVSELQSLSNNLQGMPAPQQVQPTRAQPSNKPQVMSSANRPMPVVTPKRTSSSYKKKTSYQTKTPPPVSGGKASVYDVRVGEHPGKSRIVLDVNAQTGFNVDIDNNEKIMIVELPDADWATSMTKSFGRSPFISSYAVEPSDNGHMLIFQLKKMANIGYKDDIPALNGSGRRIVIDLTN